MILDAIGIVASDINKSIEFYKLLNINFIKSGDGDHYECVTPSGLRLMLDSEELMKSLDSSWEKNIGSTQTFCFKTASPKKVDAICDSIKSAKFRIIKEPWDAFWGQRYSTVLDPDGHRIDIFADLSS